jgi:CDP-diacylglycerol--serine O-phosphatidyltransferase
MANFISQHIPNTLTCCNLVSGCVATTYAMSLDLKMAMIWIIIGAVFDFFDGLSARLIGVSSPIGKELDSLADVTTFGVAPSTMLYAELGVMDYPSLLEPLRWLIPYLAYVMAAFSALRLAKFNIDTRQTSSFIGLPTPANALFWSSVLVGMTGFVESSSVMVVFIIAGIFFSSWLMVCELPMFALKFKHWGWQGNQVRYIFIAIAIVTMILLGVLEGFCLVIAIFFVISCYIALRDRRGKQSSNNQ